jgi:hypothetical protein
MTKLAKFGVEILSKEVEKSYKAFNQMSASGALFTDGVTGMRNAAWGAGLTVEQMSNVVKANSAKMAEAGIGVGAATKMFGQVATSMKVSGVREQLMKLGFGVEEQVSLMADVTKRLRQSGKLVTSKDVEAATEKYAKNLRLIADITGEDAKRKMEETEQATKQLLFTKKMTEMGYNMEDVNEAMSHLSKQQQKDIIDLVGFGAVTNETGAVMRAQLPAFRAHENAILDSIKSHKFSAQTVLDSAAQHNAGIQKQVMANDGMLRAFAQNADGVDGLSEAYTDARNLTLKQTKESIAEGRKGLTQGTTPDKFTKELIDAEAAAQDLKVGLEKELLPFIKDFVHISKLMLGQVKKMLDDLPKELTEDEKNRVSEERKKKNAFGQPMATGSDEQVLRGMKRADWLESQGIKRSPGGVYIGPNGENLGIMYENIPNAPKFDKGGTIGAGKVGIAGENGPELIGGPSTVLSTISTNKLLDVINALKLQAGSLTGDDGMDKTVVNSPALQAEIARQLQGLNQTIADSAVSTKGPSSVLSNATVESLVTAIDAMREMKGTRTGENDFDWKVGMSEGRMATLKDRVKGFEGFDANQLQEEFMKRPEADPIKRARKQMDDEEYGTTDTNSAETNAHLAELVKLMKDNVDHTARVAANTN